MNPAFPLAKKPTEVATESYQFPEAGFWNNRGRPSRIDPSVNILTPAPDDEYAWVHKPWYPEQCGIQAGRHPH